MGAAVTPPEAERWRALCAGGTGAVLDVREADAFSRGHLRGAVSAPATAPAWDLVVGRWVRTHGVRHVLLVGPEEVLGRTREPLTEQLAGVAAVEAAVLDLEAWAAAGWALVRYRQVTVDEVAAGDGWTVLDVREPHEWAGGVVPGALRMPLGTLVDRGGSLPADARYAVICAHGHRSAVAARFLADRGLHAVNVVGGMAAWAERGHPLVPPE